MKSKKAKEVEKVLGIKLKDERRDLEAIEEEWKAFFNRPGKYAGTCVVDMVNLWYGELYLETLPMEGESQCRDGWDVCLTSMGATRYLTSFPDEFQAEEFCERNNWQYMDENEFVWNLEYNEAGAGR